MQKIFKEIKKVSNLIYQKGWACSNEGNLSVLLNNLRIDYDKKIKIKFDFSLSDLNGKYILISSKGARIRDLQENPQKNFSFLKIEKNKIYLIKGKEPSTEVKVHILCHKQIKDENFLLHVHPVNTIAISHLIKDEGELNKILKDIHFEFRYIFPEGVGFIGEKRPGSLELANKTAKKIKNYKCVIWKKHGIIARGKSFEECFDRIEVIEKLAQILLKLV